MNDDGSFSVTYPRIHLSDCWAFLGSYPQTNDDDESFSVAYHQMTQYDYEALWDSYLLTTDGDGQLETSLMIFLNERS